MFNAARLLQQRGAGADALALFERAVTVNARFAEGHFYLAQARLAAGDLDGAATAARAGLTLDRASSTAPLGHFVLADVAMRQGRMAEAAKEFEHGKALERRAARGVSRP
jgi:tetratricopeptide (TPR) repeat protein